MHSLSFTWNPASGIDLGFYTVQYYSLMFVISFVLGWYMMNRIYKNEEVPHEKLDSLFIYMVVAILVGARLGHVIFYQSDLITQDPLAVFLPIETKPEFRFTGFRGLASHGAAIAVIVAMYLYSKKILKKPILWILDRVVLPVALGAMFVRFGNFMNSEIIGKATTADFPLGVRFIRNHISNYEAGKITGIADINEAYKAIETDPQYAEVLDKIPFSHPAQLYEAIGYIFVFLILMYFYWKTDKRKQRGFLFGLFLVLLWSVRFVAEIFKISQGGFENKLGGALSTGQWLSIPFIIAGIYFMVQSSKKKMA